MPKIKVNGAELFYNEAGTGPETIVFAHGLVFSGRMFDEQVSALKDRYRCITFDFRGQGQSQVTPDGYDMDSLCEDAAQLIERLDCAPCHFLGFSMGGFVAMRLALRRPELVKSLILADTSADPEPNKIKYNVLCAITRLLGVSAVVNQVTPILFGHNFLTDPERKDLVQEWRYEILANKKTITNEIY